ncbi:MAG: ABC transporter permease, partial [Phycisphaerae bacterium]
MTKPHDNTPALREVVYTAQSELRRPGQMLANLARDLRGATHLGFRLFLRDFRAKYRQSLLGYLWVFLPPVAATLMFVLLTRMRVFNAGALQIPYPLFALIGTIVWNVFTQSLQAPLAAFTAAASYISRIHFPHESLLISVFLSVAVDSAIRLLILVPVLIYYGFWSGPAMLLLPLVLLAVIICGMALGLVILPGGMLFQDFQKALPMFLSLWMFLTPVAYQIPSRTAQILNPATALVLTARDLVTG